MGRTRVASAIGLAMLMALSTIGAPATAQEAAADPKQPSVQNPHMHFWGTSDLSSCWTHFDGNDSSGSANDGYGERTFSEGQQVQIDFSCRMQDNLKEDMYLNSNGTTLMEFVVNIDSMDCSDNQECTNMTVILMQGNLEIAQKVWPVEQVNSANDIKLEWELPVESVTERWNRSSEEPHFNFKYSAPGWSTLDCVFFFDCPGYFRFYYSGNSNNTVEVNFPVINMTEPVVGEEDEGGLIGGVSDSLPGFGLMAGVGSLALAAVAASRLSREE